MEESSLSYPVNNRCKEHTKKNVSLDLEVLENNHCKQTEEYGYYYQNHLSVSSVASHVVLKYGRSERTEEVLENIVAIVVVIINTDVGAEAYV